MAQWLVVVCTPAGFGKTTLLADWAASANWPVAWLSLDEGDNDPARFWRYVVAALDRVHGGLAERILPLLTAPTVLSSQGVVTTLINQLEAAPDEVALVLDDYHAVESTPIHDSMAFLLRRLPPQLHLVIASRSDPPLPLARLRAGGQLAELRAADLRFTPEEAAAFLQEVSGLGLSSDAVATLETRTEGWAAGLQLAALSLRERPDPDAFLDAFTGSHRYVLDYLSEEVLACHPEQLVRFLLETSILERLSGPLCDAVTGDSDGQGRLEELERANLFLVPLDDERRWWRLHHLFGDLLRARLQQAEADRVPELHRRAAAWCEQHGLIEDAIRHALAASDPLWAARLVEEQVNEALLHAETTILARWLSLLPDGAVRSRPALCLAQGLMQFYLGQLDSVDRLLKHAERAFDHEQEERGLGVPTLGGMAAEIPPAIALLRAELAVGRGDAEGTARFAQSALSQLAKEERGPRFFARWLLAAADWMGGRSEAAEAAFAELLAEAKAEPGSPPMMSSCWTLARVQRTRGKLGAALGTYREGLRFATEGRRISEYHASDAHIGIAQVHYQRNELDGALRHVSAGIEFTHQVAELTHQGLGLVDLAWIRQAIGDVSGAIEVMNEAYRMNPSTDVAPLWNLAPAERARLLLAHGQVAEAERWTEEQRLREEAVISYPGERAYLVQARVFLARSEPARALGLLERLEALAESQARTESLIEIRALRALGLQAAGDHQGALALLAGALALAQPEGYVRVFAEEGPPMAALLRSLGGARRRGRVAAGPGAAAEHLQRVIGAFEPAREPADRAAPAVTGLVEPLTDRELEVLRLLAAGRRNQEIARELVVTLETVKKHVSHLFDKLGAASRTEAVAHARKLGLPS